MTELAFRLEPIGFSALSRWRDDDHLAAFAAFVATAGAIEGQPALAAIARAATVAGISSAEEARQFFEVNFVPHRVVQDGACGFLTGYYEPVLAASRLRTAAYPVPVYRRPDDLETVVPEAERGATNARYTHMKRTGAGLEPYFTRAEIEQGALAGRGLEFAWLADPVDAFVLHVQGSGALSMPDGSIERVTYAGKNGHPYTSVGRAMIDDGHLPAEGLSMQTMVAWLKADAERARPYLWRNESFVFFAPLEGDAPAGVLGTPLHTGRSLAVDTAFHALGLPIWVSSPTMEHIGAHGLARLMVAHDVGSAIKGPERGDVFFGTGEDALALAGVTKHPATLTVLLPARAT